MLSWLFGNKRPERDLSPVTYHGRDASRQPLLDMAFRVPPSDPADLELVPANDPEDYVRKFYPVDLGDLSADQHAQLRDVRKFARLASADILRPMGLHRDLPARFIAAYVLHDASLLAAVLAWEERNFKRRIENPKPEAVDGYARLAEWLRMVVQQLEKKGVSSAELYSRSL